MNSILIMPFGEVDRNALDFLARALRETYRCDAVVENRTAVPDKTYNDRRKQYSSTRILKAMEKIKRRTDERNLGVIDAAGRGTSKEAILLEELDRVMSETVTRAVRILIAVVGGAR